MYFGKLIPQKGVDVLLAALAGVDARVVVAGFGPRRTELEALARERGVRALFTGALEHRHLAPLLALADACAVPSVFPEAFGMVAAEAAAAGCPPVVADHSGLAEVGSVLARPTRRAWATSRPVRPATSGAARPPRPAAVAAGRRADGAEVRGAAHGGGAVELGGGGRRILRVSGVS